MQQLDFSSHSITNRFPGVDLTSAHATLLGNEEPTLTSLLARYSFRFVFVFGNEDPALTSLLARYFIRRIITDDCISQDKCTLWLASSRLIYVHQDHKILIIAAGLHKLCHPTIRDGNKFRAHGEHGDVFLFSNLGALWFSGKHAPALGDIHCMFI